MKKTLLFSNIIGDVTVKENSNIKFNKYMEENVYVESVQEKPRRGRKPKVKPNSSTT